MATELNKLHFQDADEARLYLEALRWPNGPICPHCGVVGGHYTLHGEAHRIGLWKCKDCREQFSVTVGTVFERSKIALNVWLQAVYLLCASKKGMSSKQLERTLGVTYKTAWFMSHRIREAMKSPAGGFLGGKSQPVEVDETYWGNVGKQAKGARGYAHKMKVVSLVERNGNKRSFHVANVTDERPSPKGEGFGLRLKSVIVDLPVD
jgi:transposase-like protein